MEKLKSKKTLIIIIILVGIFCTQFYYLMNNTMANEVLDPSITTASIDYTYIILENLTEYLLEYIDDDSDDIAIRFLINQDTLPYTDTGGTDLIYLRYVFYPYSFDKVQSNQNYTYFNIENGIKGQGWDYILMIGKDAEILDQVSTSDYTLYKANADTDPYTLIKLAECNYGLYELYKNMDNDEFAYLIDLIKAEIEDNWNFSAISLMFNFANDLYLNNDYEDAITYSLYYINNVDFINEYLNMNLGYIYESLGDYETAISYFSICKRNSACNMDVADEAINRLNEVIAQ